jgi:hypothetical protein
MMQRHIGNIVMKHGTLSGEIQLHSPNLAQQMLRPHQQCKQRARFPPSACANCLSKTPFGASISKQKCLKMRAKQGVSEGAFPIRHGRRGSDRAWHIDICNPVKPPLHSDEKLGERQILLRIQRVACAARIAAPRHFGLTWLSSAAYNRWALRLNFLICRFPRLIPAKVHGTPLNEQKRCNKPFWALPIEKS